MTDFPQVRILCIGDMMLDRFVTGSVDRISPEAPVPIFKLGSVRAMLGGVGNVVANLRSLGVVTSVVARIGDDSAGREVADLLGTIGATFLPIRAARGIPTTVKSRFVSGHNHVLRVDEEVIAPLSPAEERRVMSAIRKSLKACSLVVLSDYAKGFLSLSLCRAIIAECRARKVPVFVDPKGRDYRKYSGATLVKPNRKELELAIGEKVVDIEKSARRLLSVIGIENAVVTLSEKGMTYVPANGTAVHIPTEVREVFDVSGAGDTTMAVLAAEFASGSSLVEAMKTANLAAGVVVGKVGTATISCDELEVAKHGAAKVFDRRSLAVQVRAWKELGLTVGFTNGCFDCLHAGHLSSLEQAKSHCDRLVVAINSDISVRRLKGPSRPVQDEETRTKVLAAMEIVDAVIVFSEKTALPLVKAIRPDIVAKEGYSIDRWPEAQWLIAHGGRAITLSRVKGYSTSNMIKRMEGGHGRRN